MVAINKNFNTDANCIIYGNVNLGAAIQPCVVGAFGGNHAPQLPF